VSTINDNNNKSDTEGVSVLLVSPSVETSLLPYDVTTTCPIAENSDEYEATRLVRRYVAAHFNLSRWYDEFFRDESDNVEKFVSREMLCSLFDNEITMDRPQEERKAGRLYIDTDDETIPFPVRLARRRADAIGFQASDSMCYFIACLASSPAIVVMYTVAFACAWQDNQAREKLHGPSTAVGYQHDFKLVSMTTPNMLWLLNGEYPSNEHGFGFGIPDATHLEKMWTAQKQVDGKGMRGNALDIVMLLPEDAVGDSEQKAA
jgi:hypothetical protein